MIDKARIIYKGDFLAGSFYLLVGVFFLFTTGLLHFFAHSIGATILAIGFFMFFLYSVGKGIAIMIASKKRQNFYSSIDTMNATHLKEEIAYTDYRLSKKQTNRRRYIYVTIVATLAAVGGVFTSQKGMISGTAIPIAMISAIEFAIGLMTEFRLTEYLRQLRKMENV
jgi:hypothetical protein